MSEQEGISQKKEANFSEWFSEVIAKAELADIRYNAKGFIVFRPWSVLAMKRMYSIYEQELERLGHLPALFPAVIPESNFLKEKEHVKGFVPEVLWITEHGNKNRLEERLALRPTSETAMYRMYSMWIRSWRDLPLKIYQSGQVWRHDTKATRPFIRGREFHWIEAHDVFATRKEAVEQVKQDSATTENVLHKIFGVPFIVFRRPEWDKFPGAVDTFAADTLMPDGKVLQQPSTHLLGQNFARAFGVKFKTRDGKEEYGWQTCYGPAISRIMASVIATHGDDKGLVFPWEIAPMQVVVVPMKPGMEKKCFELCEKLHRSGISCFVDDTDKMPGWKFNKWEMKGVPIRLEIGPREIKGGEATLARRDTGKKKVVKESSLVEEVERQGRYLSKSLREKADKIFQGMFHKASAPKELEKKLEKGGFVMMDFCSISSAGRGCSEKVAALGGDVRGVRTDKAEAAKGKCPFCNKKATCKVYIAKAY